jgi:hypothetical protein
VVRRIIGTSRVVRNQIDRSALGFDEVLKTTASTIGGKTALSGEGVGDAGILEPAPPAVIAAAANKE